MDYVDQYLDLGFRIMFLAIKMMSSIEVKTFLWDLKNLQLDQNSSQDQIYQFKSSIESNLTLLGATAIEDKL